MRSKFRCFFLELPAPAPAPAPARVPVLAPAPARAPARNSVCVMGRGEWRVHHNRDTQLALYRSHDTGTCVARGARGTCPNRLCV
jgi:hypothetical protein